LQSMRVEDTREWYRNWYAPNNALLVVAGDVDPKQVFDLADKTYGRVPSRALPARKPQIEPAQRGVRRLRIKAPAENPSVLMGFRVPKLEAVDGSDDAYALELLSAVLDLDENGRLTRSVVRGSRVANRAGAGYDMVARGPVLFLLSGTPAQGKSTEDVEAALRGEITRIARDGVGDDELRRVKAQYVASRVYKRDSVFGQAMEAAGLEISGFSHTDADAILERIRKINVRQIQDVAGRYFDEDSLTVVTLDPQPLPKDANAGKATLRTRH